jgi:hypothetical protein
MLACGVVYAKAEREKHGNVGNTNAAKEKVKDGFIKLRCEAELKNEMVALAQKIGENATIFVETSIRERMERLKKEI